MAHDATAPRRFVKIAVLTLSDTRTLDTDTSGAYLQQAAIARQRPCLPYLISILKVLASCFASSPTTK